MRQIAIGLLKEMRQNTKIDGLDIHVWEGKTDIVERVVRAMSGHEVDVLRADGTSINAPRDSGRPALAILSVSVMDTGTFSRYASGKRATRCR